MNNDENDLIDSEMAGARFEEMMRVHNESITNISDLNDIVGGDEAKESKMTDERRHSVGDLLRQSKCVLFAC